MAIDDQQQQKGDLLGADQRKTQGDNVQDVLTLLFSESRPLQLQAISLAGQMGTPLLLRALLWKYADGVSLISSAVDEALAPHLNRIRGILWRESASPIRAVRAASANLLKQVAGIQEVGKFFPLLDDYELTVRDKAKQAIRGVVARELDRLDHLPNSEESHSIISAAYREFLALTVSGRSKQQFGVEILTLLGVHSPSAFWHFLAEMPGIDLNIFSGEFTRNTDQDLRVLLYRGLVAEESRAEVFVLQTLRNLLQREPISGHLEIISRFQEPEKQRIVRTLDQAGLFDRFLAKFWEISLVRQQDLLALVHYTFMETHADFLRSCFTHSNPDISSQALFLLAKCKAGLQQGDIAKALGSQEPKTVLSAVAILAEEGTVESLPGIVPLLNHHNDDVARQVALCVARISERQLLTRFDSLGDKALEQIAKTLHRLNPNLIGDISAKLDTLSGKQKTQSVRILLSLSTEQEAREALETLMEDEDSHVRASAAKGVSGFDAAEVAEVLGKLLQDEDPRVRANAIEEIQGMPNQRVVEMLFQSAQSRHGREKANALRKLWELGYRGYELSVAQMVEDPDPYIRASGLWVVGEIESLSLMKLALGRLTDTQPIVRKAAVNAIRKQAEPEQVRSLFALMKDPDESVRQAVSHALKERLHLDVVDTAEQE